MKDYNKLYEDTYHLIQKFLKSKNNPYYNTIVTKKYKDLFHRDALACISFFGADKEQHYMYFNGAYNIDLNRMVFTSITIVSRENLSKNVGTYETKVHIDSIDDVNGFLDYLEYAFE